MVGQELYFYVTAMKDSLLTIIFMAKILCLH